MGKINGMVPLGLPFGDLVLPLVCWDDGFDRVPLKPIMEDLGVDWSRQHKKMQTPYFVRRFGICIGQMFYAGQMREMVLIRVDRVAACLNSLSPDAIRAQGNIDAADWLEAKHQEWDQVLHEYELKKGDLIRERSSRNTVIRTFLAVVREKKSAPDVADRKALAEILGGLAVEMNIQYQPDLTGTED